MCIMGSRVYVRSRPGECRKGISRDKVRTAPNAPKMEMMMVPSSPPPPPPHHLLTAETPSAHLETEPCDGMGNACKCNLKSCRSEYMCTKKWYYVRRYVYCIIFLVFCYSKPNICNVFAECLYAKRILCPELCWYVWTNSLHARVHIFQRGCKKGGETENARISLSIFENVKSSELRLMIIVSCATLTRTRTQQRSPAIRTEIRRNGSPHSARIMALWARIYGVCLARVYATATSSSTTATTVSFNMSSCTCGVVPLWVDVCVCFRERIRPNT